MSPKLRIAVDGDEVEITGPREVVTRAVDTGLLNYVEIDGYIVVQLCDPVQHAGRLAANGAVRKARIQETVDSRQGGNTEARSQNPRARILH